MTDLTPGTPAPDFSLPRDGGGEVSLADMKGKKVVLYFYPKDDTSGCTKEAIGFTEMDAEFAAAETVVIGISKDTVAKHDKFVAKDAFHAANAEVLGVSKDPVKKHDKFRDKHGLKVTLLSDEEGDVCERYGVWKEKSMYGKTYMGIERTTVLIDEEGKIAQVWPKVKVPGHVEAVLEAVQG